jgi:hypothetical protein
MSSGVVIQVRGTHGSGKTSAVRAFMERYPHENLYNADGKIVAVQVTVPEFRRPVYLIGKYDNACGGMDAIKTQEEAATRVINAWRCGGHVLCEGVLSSGVSAAGTFPRMLIEAVDPQKLKFRSMNTPLEVCIERVVQRRAGRGKDGPFDPRNVVAKYKQVLSAHKKYEDGGYDIAWLDYNDPFTQLYNLMAMHDDQ